MALKLNKNSILNIAIIILAIIFAFNIYKGQNITLEWLKQKRDTELKKNEVLGDIGQLENAMNSYKKFFNRDSSQVINILNNIARDSSVKIISIKPQPEVISTIYINYPFNLSLSVDNYHALGRFVSRIESYSNVYVVEKVEVKPSSKASKADKESRLNVDLRVSAVSLRN